MIFFKHEIFYLFVISLIYTGMVHEITDAQSWIVNHH